MRVHEAEAEVEEQRSWVCAFCNTTMIEDDRTKPYCRACHEYLKDIEAGLFDDWGEHDGIRG